MDNRERFRSALAGLAVLLCALLTGNTGCLFPDVDGVGTVEEVRSAVPRDLAPGVDPDELRTLTGGQTAFALDLYRALSAASPDALFFSPYSLSTALAMTFAGARGETAAQMAQALHFDLPPERLHPAFNALDLALSARGSQPLDGEGDAFALHTANALWGQRGHTFLDGFLDTLARHYGAGLRLLDFGSEPEGARLTINRWVSDQTEARIQDLIPRGLITPDTVLVLTNAIYFNASWRSPFDPDLTRPGVFHRLDGTTTSVPMMRVSDTFPYAAFDGGRALALPYVGGALSMVLLVPDAGNFSAFERALDAPRLAEILSRLSEQSVQLTLPKFRLRAEFLLKDALGGLGMPLAFSPEADFSGMDGARGLTIGEVVHQAFVSVDEAGTEAAAATAVVVVRSALPLALTVDVPFVFLVRDEETGAILFLGRVLDPS